ncbi:N-terminal acetyltransferase C complex subunit MAK10 [Lachancea thermotolerans]
MEDLEAQLAQLKLERQLVDVTDAFSSLASRMKPESIIKDPSFDLFEGTHSLEIDNLKLDSSLLELSPEEKRFDCSTAYGGSEEEKLKFVTAVADRLCRSIMVWLAGFQTLPTTVLSCRYVEDAVRRYTDDPSTDLSSCLLQTGNPLFDQVLTSCVVGSCFFVKFVSTLFKAGVVFEEEDLNCNTMGLNMLSMVPITTIREHMDRSIALLEAEYKHADQLVLILKLLRNLIEFQDYLPSKAEDLAAPNKQPLLDLMQCAQKLKVYAPVAPEVCTGAFSPGIQKRLSNQFPPRDIVEPAGEEYEAYVELCVDMLKVLAVTSARSASETLQFAFFFNRTRQRHVVARAFFPLYLMRDDQTVLGKYTFNDFSKEHLLDFSLCGTNLAHELLDAPENSALVQKFNEFMQEVSGILFEWYQNTAQNRCRYRQGYNRQLLLWDSLQAQIETFELELEAQGIKDELQDSSSFMPLTTWVFYMKLRAMLDFVLKGFELDVYKPWEFFSMFWYAYYLAQHLENCLQRTLGFIEKLITSIHNMNKKLKKLKAGEKKEKLRAKYRWSMENDIPQLNANLKFVTYSLMECTAVKVLSLSQVFHFAVLQSSGLIDSKPPGGNKFTSPEFIHKLRFKTFASIGVPELPSYQVFENSLKDFTIAEPMFTAKLARSLAFTKSELEGAKAAIDTIVHAIHVGDGEPNLSVNTGTRLVKEQADAHYSALLRTFEALVANGQSLQAKLGSVKDGSPAARYHVNVSRPDGASSYFPVLALSENQ